ncbi:lignostilbene-alpha,beta-dioxygenase-like enzyme [Synechococcus sp. PCC 7502]|uniref:carotenoid oxygenase family protein n=1 Tax=Synechococcus sp. PCC 7502 TaxID=1173263 RepID=UPI00029FC006|nr:carotenoid oxygenase family protein [Synechococcus sp. PCC 7502]AFY75268.1 lignostilbene-alpha,beta-dioxygenase-like enzyme [Synechococcus sp. PCC 7502]
MTTTIDKQAKQASWAKAIAKPASEFPLTQLSTISGQIPENLKGSLYRNGPARLERGEFHVGHWFDGDGAILAVHFAEGQARATYRYVQTAGYLEEEKANKLIYGNYGMTATGAWWQRFSKSSKNVANTSVIALPDKLLALWEGGLPHALDLETLETFGIENLEGLENRLPYSAHPKHDANTGEIFNFGISYGKNAILHLYRSDRNGKLIRKNQATLAGLSMIHDFVLAGDYLIFCVPPLRLNPFPLLLNLKSYSDSLAWKPEEGTEILVFDRHNLELVSRSVAEPWFQWHFGNGYSDRDGNVVFDLIRYPNFATNQYLKEIASGKTKTHAQGTLWKMRLNPKTGEFLEMSELCDRGAEFPSVAPDQVGQNSRYTYLSIHRPDAVINQELFGAIARYDYQTNKLTEANLGKNRYPMEPLFAPDSSNPDTGYVITVVFDGDRECSEVWVFDSDRLDSEPVCRLALPSIVPMGFHGTWRS